MKFSLCDVWKKQYDYFNNQGNKVWSEDKLPHYITNNPIIANSYAQIAWRFIQDCLVNYKINQNSPIYIIELGAGLGKFGYLFLQKLLDLLEHFNKTDLKICYVMVDFAKNNLQTWLNQPALQQFIQKEILDFSIADITNTIELFLNQKNCELSSNSILNPTIIISNYVFDMLAQDIVRTENGILFEGLANKNEIDNTNKQLDFVFNKIDLPYYNSDKIDKILLEYKHTLKNCTFLVPIGSIKAINNIAKLTNNNFLLITSDKGHTSLDSMDGIEKPHFALHKDCFSMMVNFDFLDRYIKLLGGDTLLDHDCEGLKTSLFCIGQKFTNLPETSLAYDNFNIYFSIKEFMCLGEAITKDINNLNQDTLLAIMKLSHWDPDIFVMLSNRLIDIANTINPGYLKIWKHGLKIIEKQYYSINSNRKILFALASVNYVINEIDEAIKFYHQFLQNFGEESVVFFNLGLCYQNKNDDKNAKQYFQKAYDYK